MKIDRKVYLAKLIKFCVNQFIEIQLLTVTLKYYRAHLIVYDVEVSSTITLLLLSFYFKPTNIQTAD